MRYRTDASNSLRQNLVHHLHLVQFGPDLALSGKETCMPPNRLEHLTEVVASVTGRRYCSSHRGEAASDTGEYIVRGNVRRWMCFVCKKKTDDAAMAFEKRKRSSYG